VTRLFDLGADDPETAGADAEPAWVDPGAALAELGERLPGLAEALASPAPTIAEYCRASAGYVGAASGLSAGQAKTAQVLLSQVLARVTLGDLRRALGLPLAGAVAGERTVGGALRPAKADVSEITEMDGLTLAVELKPVHLAVGRAIWNRFGDIRTFAVNVHLKFPFCVVGGVMTLPTMERVRSGDDEAWKPTTHLVERAIARFVRAGGRHTEGDAPHLLEAIAVVVFDHASGEMIDALPPAASGLRWDGFVDGLAAAYDARFADL
jgi:hypothetical protein